MGHPSIVNRLLQDKGLRLWYALKWTFKVNVYNERALHFWLTLSSHPYIFTDKQVYMHCKVRDTACCEILMLLSRAAYHGVAKDMAPHESFASVKYTFVPHCHSPKNAITMGITTTTSVLQRCCPFSISIGVVKLKL